MWELKHAIKQCCPIFIQPSVALRRVGTRISLSFVTKWSSSSSNNKRKNAPFPILSSFLKWLGHTLCNHPPHHLQQGLDRLCITRKKCLLVISSSFFLLPLISQSDSLVAARTCRPREPQQLLKKWDRKSCCVPK